MWVVTAGNSLINLSDAHRVVIEGSDDPRTLRLRAYFPNGEPALLAEVTSPDPNYSQTAIQAFHQAVLTSLMDGERVCDLRAQIGVNGQ